MVWDKVYIMYSLFLNSLKYVMFFQKNPFEVGQATCYKEAFLLEKAAKEGIKLLP